MPEIQTGTISLNSSAVIPSSGTYDYDVTFSSAFSETPYIFFALANVQSVNYGYVQFSSMNVSTTGFTLRIHNASTSSALTPVIRWMAVAV